MNAVLIIAHAPLATALREGVLHCFPDAADAVAAVDVQAQAAPEASLAQAEAALQSLRGEGDKVLLLTDLFGATPCNVAQRLVDGVHTRLIAGANLPMALRAVSYRAEPLDAMAARALAGGAQGVMPVAAATGPQNQSRPPTTHDSEHHHHQQ